jgi:hypothetical protein
MIDDFRKLDLHDTPIKSIAVNFETAILVFTVSQHDDNDLDFFEIEMRFFQVSNLFLDKIPDISIVEIIDVRLEATNSNSTSVEFSLAYDYPFALLRLQFEFNQVEIVYPSSRKPHMI